MKMKIKKNVVKYTITLSKKEMRFLSVYRDLCLDLSTFIDCLCEENEDGYDIDEVVNTVRDFFTMVTDTLNSDE